MGGGKSIMDHGIQAGVPNTIHYNSHFPKGHDLVGLKHVQH